MPANTDILGMYRKRERERRWERRERGKQNEKSVDKNVNIIRSWGGAEIKWVSYNDVLHNLNNITSEKKSVN